MNDVDDDRSGQARAPIGRTKAFIFAMTTTILVLGMAETGLRIAGVQGAQDRTTTWFPDHILNPPLVHIAHEDEPERSWVRAGQSHHFHPFNPEGKENTFRVAVLGGSAAHGYGVLEPGAFPHRVEQLLQAAVPDSEIQVINFGTVAWSSQQLLWASRQLWDLSSWDLIILYSGHNELLELSSWKTYMSAAEHRRYTRALLWNQRLEGLRIFQVGRKLLGRDREQQVLERAQQRAAQEQASDGDENLQQGRDPVGAIPAQQLDQLKSIPAEERARIGKLERGYAASTYRHNVGKILRQARQRGTPMLLINPAPSDFHDPISFPYPGKQGARIKELLEQAEDLMNNSDWEGMERNAREVLARHDDASAMYMLAQSMQYRNKMEEAQRWYIKARAYTEYPNRVVPEVSEAIRSFANEDGVLGVIDSEALFRARHPDGFIEYQLVYDHCHPSVEGNYVLAGAVVRTLLEAKLPALSSAKRIDIDGWVDRGRTAMASKTTADPRLWEWDGRDYSGENVVYIADFQGDWQNIREAQEQALAGTEPSAMDWLWAGNGRFYDYEVESALEAWEQALSLDPQLCLAFANRAYALRLVGRRELARVDANRALECDPGNVDYKTAAELLTKLSNASGQ